MKTLNGWNALREFGIEPLTLEACGLAYRVLCDLTPQGKQIVERCFDVKIESEPWNSGTEEKPHVASIMLSPEMVQALSVFALLESGYRECFLIRGGSVVARDDEDEERFKEWLNGKVLRKFSYGGTAGSRNTHLFTGRES